MTASALIRGSVMHARSDELARRVFRYPVYVASIDLAELPALDRELGLFSHGGRNLFALHDADYEASGPGIAAGLADLLAANGLPAPHATRLVTNLRVAGYVFNPVSFFLNYDAAGALVSVIAEINNTYGGRRRYVLGPDQRIDRRIDQRIAGTGRVGFRHIRELFVSPFLHGPASYDFWFDAPLDGQRLSIAVHVARPRGGGGPDVGDRGDGHDRPGPDGPGRRIFTARLTGTRHVMTNRALLAAALRYPLMTAQVIGLIHLQAVKLRLRGVPYFRPGPDHRPRLRVPARRADRADQADPRPPIERGHGTPFAPDEVTSVHVPHAVADSPTTPRLGPLSRSARTTAISEPGFPHPLVAPLPRVSAPLGRALRWLAISRLRAGWRGGRLDLVLPSGKLIRIGDAGGADATLRVHDDRAFLRLVLRGEMGGGEAFVAGEWSSDDLVGALRLVLRATGARGVESPLTRVSQLGSMIRHRRAANTPHGSQRNIHAHYDLGNAFYQLFLDPETLSYSCALFTRPAEPGAPARTLAEAQRAKLDRLCDLLALSPDDHLLEIGCGWGGMAIHAARTRGCRVTAITLSRQQQQLAAARVAAAGLADRVDIGYRDYRDQRGSFDKIVSIEMLEAVGYDYLPTYFAAAARLLRPGGRLAVQTITMPDQRFETYRRRVDWMQTYIFPGAVIPSLGAIEAAARPAGLAIECCDDIGPDYAVTLAHWRERFVAALPQVAALGFDEPFLRTWLLYLAFSEAAFAERTLGDHQLLLRR